MNICILEHMFNILACEDSAVQIFSYARHRRLQLPLVLHAVEAGFPSPAEGQIDKALDLNDLLIEHPNATYFVRVQGDSMQGAGIYHGDLLIVDRAKSPKSGDVIIAALNGAFTVKRWRLISQGSTRGHGVSREQSPSGLHPCGGELVAAHPHYPPIRVGPEDDFVIWGVVCYTVHRP